MVLNETLESKTKRDMRNHFSIALGRIIGSRTFLYAVIAVLSIFCVVLLAMKVSPAKAGYSFAGFFRKPAPGYVFAQGDFVWCPGSRHPDHPHVYAGAEENSWLADDGYAFVTNAGFTVKWVPDVPIGTMQHVMTGKTEGQYMIKHNCETCAGAGNHEARCGECNASGILKVESICTVCSNGVVNCASCGATGKTKCSGYQCAGGRCTALFCLGGYIRNGFFSVPCAACGGTGKCPKCKGAGAFPCGHCNGHGKYTCRVCGGKMVVEKDVKCHVCDGKKKLITPCSKCDGCGFVWREAPPDVSSAVKNAHTATRARMLQRSLAKIGDALYALNSARKNRQSKEGSNAVGVESANAAQQMAAAIQNQQMMQRQFELDWQLAQMMMQQQQAMNQAILNIGMQSYSPMPMPSFSPVTSGGYGKPSTKRTCGIHGVEYDFRFGSCPQCKAPKFGLNFETKCSRCGYSHILGQPCPHCR